MMMQREQQVAVPIRYMEPVKKVQQKPQIKKLTLPQRIADHTSCRRVRYRLEHRLGWCFPMLLNQPQQNKALTARKPFVLPHEQEQGLVKKSTAFQKFVGRKTPKKSSMEPGIHLSEIMSDYTADCSSCVLSVQQEASSKSLFSTTSFDAFSRKQREPQSLWSSSSLMSLSAKLEGLDRDFAPDLSFSDSSCMLDSTISCKRDVYSSSRQTIKDYCAEQQRRHYEERNSNIELLLEEVVSSASPLSVRMLQI